MRVGRNPPSVLGDIHLIGIPAPQAGVHRRLLSLSRRGRVLSPFPPASSTQAHHLPQPAEVSFCALARLLSRHLMVPRARFVDGVSSNPWFTGFGVARQLADPSWIGLTAVNKPYGKRYCHGTEPGERGFKKKCGAMRSYFLDRIASRYPRPPTVNPIMPSRRKAAIGVV